MNSHKPVGKAYKPKNRIFDTLMTFNVPFDDILYFECALRGTVSSTFSRKIAPKSI